MKIFKKNQKITWHNDTETGVVKEVNNKQITIKWESGAIITSPIILVENYIKL